jgi:undecaprenyl-diphosphatase
VTDRRRIQPGSSGAPLELSLRARPKAEVAVLLGLVFASVATIFLGWLTDEVLEGDTARFDGYVRATVHSAASPVFTSAMLFFTSLGSVLGLTCLFVATLIVYWILHWWRAVGLILITMLGAVVLEEALKLGFHRRRPVPFFGLAVPHSYSYPSGHALFSFTFFSTVASLTAARTRQRWLRIVIWLAAILTILNIGFSRIYLGVHYPTDVIAGYLIGIIWVAAVSLADRFYRGHRAEG